MKREPETLEEALDLCWGRMREIMIAKRAMRGPDNIERQGLFGVVTRVVEDKMARVLRVVKTAYLRGEMAQRGMPDDLLDRYLPLSDGEREASLEDDFLDGGNYFIICWLLLKGWWRLPLISEIRRET